MWDLIELAKLSEKVKSERAYKIQKKISKTHSQKLEETFKRMNIKLA